MPLVVPGVARFALNMSYFGRSVVNVLDYRIDTTGSTMSRSEAVEAQAESLITAWEERLAPMLVSVLALNSVSYVDLNSATGVTGSETASDSVTLPVTGDIVGAPIPVNASVLVTKNTTSARGRRNGRLFWAGITEAATDAVNGNRISTTSQAAYQTAWNQFLSDTNEVDTLGTAFESHMCVVSITSRGPSPSPGVPGPPLTGESSDVTSLTVDALLATQRRRLRG